MRALANAESPLSCSGVLDQLGDSAWDPATVYRNLVRLEEVGVALVVSRADGIARYALAGVQDDHHHPHFVCDACGGITCLPAELSASIALEGPWAESIREARVQLRGVCPKCVASDARATHREP
jgi:Fur family ferric uptake transcriptional regulator